MYSESAGGGAHDRAEQQLAADVARDRALDQVRVVVGLGAVAVGHQPPHQRADVLAVDEHVHRQHEHEHEVEDRARRFGRERAAERGEFAGASLATLPSMLCSAVLPCLTSFRWMPWWSSSVCTVAIVLLASLTMFGKVARERPHLIGDRVGQQEADARQREEECEVHGEHRQPARNARAVHEGHGRIEDQRDERGDDEDDKTLPAAFASAHSASSASGSSTSCTQRGTTTRAARLSASGDLSRFGDSGVSGVSASMRQLALVLGRGSARSPARGGFPRDACHLPPTIARVWLSPRRRPAPAGAARILFVGDVVGGLGRNTLLDCLPVLRERYAPTFVVVNGENAAGGLGITPKNADQMFAAGVDAITLGNHTYHRREIYPYLASHERIVRPANFLRSQPGRGTCVVEHDGVRLGVVNMSGNLYLRAGRSAFTEIEVALGELGEVEHIARRHARGGDLGEGGDGLAPRRPRDGGRGHAHARADRRRARAAGRHARTSPTSA